MHPLFKTCIECDLQGLLNKVECTLIYLMKRKHQILIYNLEDSVDEEKIRDLIRYRRVLSKRIYNPTYPSGSIKTLDITSIASLIALRDGNCSECETCLN